MLWVGPWNSNLEVSHSVGGALQKPPESVTAKLMKSVLLSRRLIVNRLWNLWQNVWKTPQNCSSEEWLTYPEELPPSQCEGYFGTYHVGVSGPFHGQEYDWIWRTRGCLCVTSGDRWGDRSRLPITFNSQHICKHVLFMHLSFYLPAMENRNLELKKISGSTSGKEPACLRRRHKRHGFDPWVGKIPLEEGISTHSGILAWRIP